MNEVAYLLESPIQVAWIWTIIVAFVGGGLAGGVLAWLNILITSNENILRIAILGTQGAGKTTLWGYFAKHMKYESNTYRNEINDCEVTIGEKTYILKGGVDIGGGDGFVGEEYESLIQDKDFVIFIFNAEKLLKDNCYDEIMQVRSRFQKIGRVLKKLSEKGQYHIIASHADKLGLEAKKEYEAKRNEIYEKIGKKYFHEWTDFNIEKNFALLDLTNNKIVREYIDKTFKK